MPKPRVSIVIPVLGDAGPLAELLPELPVSDDLQVVVANGAPDDRDLASVRDRHPDVDWVEAPPGRGRQMNAGAERATGTWLLFLHADARLGAGWQDELVRAGDVGCVGGCYRLAIDSERWQARVVEWGVGLRVRWLGLAYGDQGLFIRRDQFRALGGYRSIPVMEDADLVRRMRRLGRWHRARVPVAVSARRWERDGWWRRTAANLWILTRYLAGRPPDQLAASYPVWGRPTGRAAAEPEGSSTGAVAGDREEPPPASR